jgi:hypothetical protein
VTGRLAPVGVPGGLFRALPGEADANGLVRCGSSVVRLDAGAYRLWCAAASGPTASNLARWGTAQEICDAAELVRDLLDAGFLVDLDSADGELSSLTAHLVGELVGTPPGEEPGFLLAGRTGVTLLVSGVVFEVLLRVSSSEALCDIAAEIDRLAGRETFGSAVEAIGQVLPELLRNEVILLDRRRSP